MNIIRTICIIFLSIILSGCVVIGGMMDAVLFDDSDVDFFQKVGIDLDKDKEYFTSDDENFSKKKAAERNCQYLEQPEEACLEAKKLSQDH